MGQSDPLRQHQAGLVLPRHLKPCVSRPSEARAGTQGHIREVHDLPPWVPALRSLRSLGRDTQCGRA